MKWNQRSIIASLATCLLVITATGVLGCGDGTSSDSTGEETVSACKQSVEDDDANTSCGASSDCAPSRCICEEGEITSRSCINGSCQGLGACDEACSDRGGWVCPQVIDITDSADDEGEFECASDETDRTCDRDSEFCFVSITYDETDGTPFGYDECQKLPDGCDSCSCARDELQDEFSGEATCSQTVSCVTSGGGHTVQCEQWN